MFFKKAPKEISLYYFNAANAGDILNEKLINDLFGIKVKEESFKTSEMIAIGSVLERIVSNTTLGKRDKELQLEADGNKKIIVWGTGMMHGYDDYSNMEFIRPAKICAVRGELTRKAVQNITGKRVKCVLADPGLLAPFILDEMPEKKYTLGIIPHFREQDEEGYHRIHENTAGSVIIDLTKPPKEVLMQIASCEAVISTSLHGLIFADALGVPNQWCELTDKILGAGYKFRDYYSSYGLNAKPYDLRGGNCPAIEEIKNNYRINMYDIKRKQAELIKCFPYHNKKTKALLKSIVY